MSSDREPTESKVLARTKQKKGEKAGEITRVRVTIKSSCYEPRPQADDDDKTAVLAMSAALAGYCLQPMRAAATQEPHRESRTEQAQSNAPKPGGRLYVTSVSFTATGPEKDDLTITEVKLGTCTFGASITINEEGTFFTECADKCKPHPAATGEVTITDKDGKLWGRVDRFKIYTALEEG